MKPPPDWEALHLERFDRWAHNCGNVACQAQADQATAAFAARLTAAGVDLDDPHQLHALLAGLSMSAGFALHAPLLAGVSLVAQMRSLAARIPKEACDGR